MERNLSWPLAAILLTILPLQAQEEDAPAGACTCCTENHHTFDFWVGAWEVLTPQGDLAGTNRIEKREGNCVLQEHWVGTSGDTGTSLTYYNASTGQWEQLWTDSSGLILKLAGGGHDGQMVLSSQPFRDADGQARVHRITWTLQNDGSVRQLWELLEGGAEVKTLFDGIYRPLK